MRKKFSLLLVGFILLSNLICYAQSDVDVVPLKKDILQMTITVTTSATALPTTALRGRRTIMVKNTSTTTVYLGSSTVTADTVSTGGFQLKIDEVFIGDISDDIILYAIVSTGTATVNVLEVR